MANRRKKKIRYIYCMKKKGIGNCLEKIGYVKKKKKRCNCIRKNKACNIIGCKKWKEKKKYEI